MLTDPFVAVKRLTVAAALRNLRIFLVHDNADVIMVLYLTSDLCGNLSLRNTVFEVQIIGKIPHKPSLIQLFSPVVCRRISLLPDICYGKHFIYSSCKIYSAAADNSCAPLSYHCTTEFTFRNPFLLKCHLNFCSDANLTF